MGTARPDPDLTVRSDCRYCGSTDLRSVLDLGRQPLANAFITKAEIADERRYPLELFVCGSCWLAQLRHVVRADLIFSEYSYVTSTSGALVRHYESLAHDLTQHYKLGEGDLVVDIGCNDGALLQAFPRGVRRVGVEPSNVAELARSRGLDVVQAFFNDRVAHEIARDRGRARVVTATNVFAHVDDIEAFTRALAQLLLDNGVVVIEVSYLPDLIAGRLFDTIYHEHLSYCSLTPMIPFFERCGLTVIDAERIALGASGPAIRVTAQRTRRAERATSVMDLLAWERRWGIAEMAIYNDFAGSVRTLREQLLALLRSLRREGHRLAGFGAPAKGNTLLNYVSADASLLEFVADNTPFKRGKLTPGTHIPILGDDELLRARPEYALLLAWNYLDFFLANSEYIKRGGRFIVPLPEPRIVP